MALACFASSLCLAANLSSFQVLKLSGSVLVNSLFDCANNTIFSTYAFWSASLFVCFQASDPQHLSWSPDAFLSDAESLVIHGGEDTMEEVFYFLNFFFLLFSICLLSGV